LGATFAVYFLGKMQLNEHFELVTTDGPALSEAELLAMLTQRVTEMFETQPDFLMSLLYRLDVEESKINRAMHPSAPEPATVGLARLVLERQKQRFETKNTVKVAPIEGDDSW
jgi:hypothetical protein